LRKISFIMVLVLIFACMFSFAMPVFADPDKKAVAQYGTPKPLANGVYDEIWNTCEGYFTTNIYQDGERLTDTVSEWRMMWDENKMYFLAIVTDSELNSNNETFWQNDCTQLFIDFANSQDFDAYSYEGTTDALGIRYAFPGVLQSPDNFLIELMGGGGYLDTDDPLYIAIDHDVQTTATGFVQQYSFDPRLYCATFKLEAGSKGGVDFINDDSMKDSDVRDVLYHWSVEGDTWGSPTNLSVFELAEKVEAPVVVEEPAVEPAAESAPVVAAVVESAPAPVVPQTGDSTMILMFALVIVSAIVTTKAVKHSKS